MHCTRYSVAWKLEYWPFIHTSVRLIKLLPTLSLFSDGVSGWVFTLNRTGEPPTPTTRNKWREKFPKTFMFYLIVYPNLKQNWPKFGKIWRKPNPPGKCPTGTLEAPKKFPKIPKWIKCSKFDFWGHAPFWAWRQ